MIKLYLPRLSKNRIFMQHLRFDVTPEVIFKPRFASMDNFEEAIAETQGFSFYVDVMDEGPELMLMKTYKLTSKTVGEIQDVPRDLLDKTVSSTRGKVVAGMYPLGDELEAWLREQLGVKA